MWHVFLLYAEVCVCAFYMPSSWPQPQYCICDVRCVRSLYLPEHFLHTLRAIVSPSQMWWCPPEHLLQLSRSASGNLHVSLQRPFFFDEFWAAAATPHLIYRKTVFLKLPVIFGAASTAPPKNMETTDVSTHGAAVPTLEVVLSVAVLTPEEIGSASLALVALPMSSGVNIEADVLSLCLSLLTSFNWPVTKIIET